MLRSMDKQLLTHLDRLCRRERTTCVEILLDLVKVEGRKLHVKLGYSSLFNFATHHLRYSESAAGRRVQAARCVRNHPEVIPLFRRGVMNLSTLCLVSRVLTLENKRTLLARVVGKSQRDVAAIVAQYAPPQKVRDRIRAVNVQRVEQAGPADAGGAFSASLDSRPTGAKAQERNSSSGRETTGEDDDGQVGLGSRQESTRPLEATPLEATRPLEATSPLVATSQLEAPPQRSDDSRGTGSTATESETQFKFQFVASAAFMRKFEAVRDLLSSRLPQGASIESVFEAGLEAFLDRHCPTRRNERRKTREEKRAARVKKEATDRTVDESEGRALPQRECLLEQPTEEPTERPSERPTEQRTVNRANRRAERATERPTKRSMKPPTEQTARVAQRRAVPAAVRDAVFERDGGSCTFVGIHGRRCGSKHDLEVDHCQPVARGGSSTMDNLRLLCAVHNRLEAEHVFGAAWMQRFGRS